MKNRDLGFNPYDELSKREWVINALKGENNSLRKLIIVSILDTCSETTRKLVYYQNPEILIFALLLKKT